MENLTHINASLDNASHINGSDHPHELNTAEGGILTGRNPFVFNEKNVLPTFIIQLLIIICMSRLIKLILSPIKQPSVIAEIISGIILGPTAFGHIPGYTATIFPKPSIAFLHLMSNFGLVLFLFLVGLELDPRMLKKSIKKSLAISLAGMALPFAMGVAVSYALYTLIEPPENSTSFIKYVLFLGVAMAITAFPVLARILTELDLLKTKVGSICISAAAVDDATSWCLLALVISLINAGSGMVAFYVFLMGLGYSLFLILVFRPLYVFFLRRSGAFEEEPSQLVMFVTLGLVFVSAFITDAIGIHAIFGGFLAGIVIPHEGGFAYHITAKLEDIVAVLFLPLYFAFSGLRTEIGTLNDVTSWAMVLLVIFVACFGKIFGCTMAARITKLTWRESFAVGTLMNCKGLVELIVLNLGFDAKVISRQTFAIMVIMALVTTFLTVPVVTRVYPPMYRDVHDEEGGEEHKAKHGKKGKKGEPSLLVTVNKVEQIPAILGVIRLIGSLFTPVAPEKPLSRRSSSNRSSMTTLPCGGLPNTNNHEGTESGGGGGSSSAALARLGSAINMTKLGGGGGSGSGRVVINALRLIELTERDSSVMLHSSQALLNDPVMKIFHTLCELAMFEVRSLAKVVTMSAFPDALANRATELKAKYILLPWSGSGSFIEDKVSPIQQMFYEPNRRRQSIHTPIQHASFIQDLLAISPCGVLVLVDRGVDQKLVNMNDQSLGQSFQQIYLPFFGGSDDRAALDVIMAISGAFGVGVNIFRIKDISRRYSMSSDVGSGIGSEDGIANVVVNPEAEESDETTNPELCADTRKLHQYGLSITMTTSEGTPPGHPNVVYTEVDSFTPITTAIKYLEQSGNNDLVILGRGTAEARKLPLDPTLGLRSADAERRKALGDIAECILLSNITSSLLIVQAKQKI